MMGMADWLGNGRLKMSGWRTYEDAKEFVHGLGLYSEREWSDYKKGLKTRLPIKPLDIPSSPERTYKAEWQGWDDWLGKKKKRNGLHVFKTTKASDPSETSAF